jgi:hypothetical protein
LLKIRPTNADEYSFVLVLYAKLAIINLIVALETGLIAARLDGAIQASYGILLIPTWIGFLISLTIWVCYCCIGCCCDNDTLTGLGVLWCCAQVCLIPIIIFFVLSVVRVEISVPFSMFFAFIPVYIFLVCCFCLMICGTASLCDVDCFHKYS